MDSEKVKDTDSDTLLSMVRDFYNRKMLSVIILTWAFSLVVIAAAVIFAVEFFRAPETDNRSMIMYAALFICCVTFVNLMKTWAWQMIHRNSIKRDIKKLKDSIVELKQTLENK